MTPKHQPTVWERLSCFEPRCGSEPPLRGFLTDLRSDCRAEWKKQRERAGFFNLLPKFVPIFLPACSPSSLCPACREQ